MRRILIISVGPVQGFIATARKTRDLWAGSQLLSDVSKSVAKALRRNGAKLIFPGVDPNNDRLDDPRFSVANVIICEVESNSEQHIKNLVEIAKNAAYDKWREFVGATQDKIQSQRAWNQIREDFWNAQTKAEDVVEFYAAWTPIKDGDEGRALARAASLLASRKNCREFGQSCDYDGAGVPKSSLDGARESVLKPEIVRYGNERIYLKAGEQLDAVGLVKRLGVQEAAYTMDCPSLLAIAIQPRLRSWLDDWANTNRQSYEAVVAFLNRQDSLGSLLNDQTARNDAQIEDLKRKIKEVDENGLYLAVLLADGDKMGATLAGLETIEKRRQFSIALSNFSSGVARLVEGTHKGLCVYAGGDDVLAFLSVDKALDCANDLRKSFSSAMSAYNETSLSVGIVVFHYRETLDQVLDFAREAEKVAKKTSKGYADNDRLYGNRNGLAVSFYSRGNAPTTVRERWIDGDNSLVSRLQYWGKAFKEGKKSQQNEANQQESRKGLPSGFPYDLHELLVSQVYPSKEWRDQPDLRVLLDELVKGVPNNQRLCNALNVIQREDELERFLRNANMNNANLNNLYKRLKEWLYPPLLTEALRRDVMRIVRQKNSIPTDSDLYVKIENRIKSILNEKELERFVNELIVAKEIGAYVGL